MSSPPYPSQISQHFSPVDYFDLDDEFDLLFGSHVYALGQGSDGSSVPI